MPQALGIWVHFAPNFFASRRRDSSKSTARTFMPRNCKSFVNIKPIGPCPATSTLSPGSNAKTFYRFKDGIHWLKHRTFFKGLFRRNLHHSRTHERHHPDVFRKTPTCPARNPRGNSRAFILGALGKGAVPAIMAIHARHVMMQCHAIANSESGRAPPNPYFDNGPGGFMPKNARRRNRAVLDLFYIGRTNATCSHLDE